MPAIVSPSPTIFHTPKLLSISPLLRHHRHLFFKNLTVKCTTTGNSRNPEQDGSGSGSGGGLKEALSGIVDSRVDELLNKEENKALLDGLNKASERVERAKRELAAIEKQEIEAKLMRDYISHLESRISEIAECQREILEAKTIVEEAQRSLSSEDEEINRTEERLESAKAASVSALVGTLAGLPIYLSQVSENSQFILPLAVTFISCALFGVTFRYVVRRDLDDFQLKTGAASAFGVVKGLATLESGPPLELEIGSFISYATKGAVYVSENLLIFIFAAVALDFCFKIQALSPFPIQKSASEAKRR